MVKGAVTPASHGAVPVPEVQPAPVRPTSAVPPGCELLNTSPAAPRGSLGNSMKPSSLATSMSVLGHPPTGPQASSDWGCSSPAGILLRKGARYPGTRGLAASSV